MVASDEIKKERKKKLGLRLISAQLGLEAGTGLSLATIDLRHICLLRIENPNI